MDMVFGHDCAGWLICAFVSSLAILALYLALQLFPVRPRLHPRLLESKPLYPSSFLFHFAVPSLRSQNIPT